MLLLVVLVELVLDVDDVDVLVLVDVEVVDVVVLVEVEVVVLVPKLKRQNFLFLYL